MIDGISSTLLEALANTYSYGTVVTKANYCLE